jgi:hypothetical protein
MDEEIQELIGLIEKRCKAEGIKPSTFGQRYFQNSRLVKRMKKSKSVTLPTYRKILEILDRPIPERANGRAA